MSYLLIVDASTECKSKLLSSISLSSQTTDACGNFLSVPQAKKKAKPSHKALGRAIHELRKEQGLTQAQLSQKTGLHISYLSGLENGSRNPTWTVLSQVSAALKVSISELAKRAERASK
jgi:DNA-binding XRE family transcriptional regulator